MFASGDGLGSPVMSCHNRYFDATPFFPVTQPDSLGRPTRPTPSMSGPVTVKLVGNRVERFEGVSEPTFPVSSLFQCVSSSRVLLPKHSLAGL
jgi:hypothetical protein